MRVLLVDDHEILRDGLAVIRQLRRRRCPQRVRSLTMFRTLGVHSLGERLRFRVRNRLVRDGAQDFATDAASPSPSSEPKRPL